MLLTIDIGNTQTTLGVFRGDVLAPTWRVHTDHRKTEDEYTLLLSSLFSSAGLSPKDVTGVGISSVVPPLSNVFRRMAASLFGARALLVEPGIKTGMPILYENPAEVGSDRIANAVAAYAEAKGPAIIVDFGTATTFCAVSGKGEYLGGSIIPGIQISADALFAKTAKLPRVDLKKPASVIGRTTVSSIQSGLFYGHISVVEGMIGRISAELGGEVRPKVFATGGLAGLFAGETSLIDIVDLNLTLKGIRILFEKNA